MDTSVFAIVGTGAAALAALAVIAAVALTVWLFIRSTARKALPVAWLLIGFCLEAIFVKQPYIQLGLQIYPNDVISLYVLLSMLAGFFYRPVPVHNSPFLLWLGLGVTIIMSFAVGLVEYGRYAGTEMRPFFYTWVAGMYCCTADLDESDLKRIGRWCIWTCYAVIAIAMYHLIRVELGLADRILDFGLEPDAVFRPVGSHYAFFISAVVMVLTMAWLRGTGTKRTGWHAAILLAFVVVLQHRSVWIATVVGLLCVAAVESRHLPRRFPLLLGFVLVVTLGVSIAASLGYLDELGRRLMQSTVSMTDSGGTFAARVDGWVRLVESWVEGGTRVLMFGFPFGHGYTRMYKGQLIEFAPHNYYLDLALRVGLVGLVLFLVPTVIAIVHAFRTKVASEFEYLLARGMAVALLASLVYYIVYPSYYLPGAATGVMLAHIIQQRRQAELRKRPGAANAASRLAASAPPRQHPNAAVHDLLRRR